MKRLSTWRSASGTPADAIGGAEVAVIGGANVTDGAAVEVIGGANVTDGAPVEVIGGAEPAGGALPAVDVHQHLWPEGLIAALRARRAPPRLRGWTLELAGEPDYPVDPMGHDVAARAAQATEDGVDLALVSLSSPLGIETLPSEEAGELLAAYHDGVLALPAPFGGWAAACLTEIDPAAVTRELNRGFAGLQLPATALLDAAGYDLVGPLLEVLEAAGKPLLIHPGPARGEVVAPAGGGAAAPARGARPRAPAAGAGRRAPGVTDTAPPWWPALVPYVQQMHAAWFAFRAYGRPRHPTLRVCFAILAGLAPLHGERFVARAGARNPVDPGVFVEVSSYGTRAVDATIRVLGIDALINGSDRPYAEPAHLELGAAALRALRTHNAQRLLNSKEAVNDLAVAAYA